jgi:hypothetical protein
MRAMLLAFGLLSSLSAISAFGAEPRTEWMRYQFDVRSLDGKIPDQKRIENSIIMSVEKAIGPFNCYARSRVEKYKLYADPNETVKPREVVALCFVALEANCMETAQVILQAWEQNPSYLINPVQPGDPWPVVSGGTGSGSGN